MSDQKVMEKESHKAKKAVKSKVTKLRRLHPSVDMLPADLQRVLKDVDQTATT